MFGVIVTKSPAIIARVSPSILAPLSRSEGACVVCLSSALNCNIKQPLIRAVSCCFNLDIVIAFQACLIFSIEKAISLRESKWDDWNEGEEKFVTQIRQCSLVNNQLVGSFCHDFISVASWESPNVSSRCL